MTDSFSSALSVNTTGITLLLKNNVNVILPSDAEVIWTLIWTLMWTLFSSQFELGGLYVFVFEFCSLSDEVWARATTAVAKQV